MDEAKYGPDDPMLSHLRTQLNTMLKSERQRNGEAPTPNPVQFQVGMQGQRKA